MPLILRLEKGSPLTYQEMDANLTYLFSASINETGSETFSGSLYLTGSLEVTGSTKFEGTFNVTGSTVVSSSFIVIGTSVVTGSHIVTGSINGTGSINLTGSLDIKRGPDGAFTSLHVGEDGFVGINVTTQTAGLEKLRVNGPLRTDDAVYVQDEALLTWSPNTNFSINAMLNNLNLNTVVATKSVILSIASNPIFTVSSSGQIFSNYPIIQTGSIDITGSLRITGSIITNTTSSLPSGNEGQILTYVSNSVSSLYVYLSGSWEEFTPSTIKKNRKTSNYTLTLADRNKLIEYSSSVSGSFTVPSHSIVFSMPTGSQILVSQLATGSLTISAGSGVTIRSYNNLNTLAGQYAGATLLNVDVNEWYLFGNLIS